MTKSRELTRELAILGSASKAKGMRAGEKNSIARLLPALNNTQATYYQFD